MRKRGAAVFDSTRSRLTLWYTGVLALVLVVFATAAYAYLARAVRERTDQSLAETVHSLVLNFTAEFEEDQTDDNAAEEVARDFQFGDRQAFIFDERRRVAASSAVPTGVSKRQAWPDAAAFSNGLAEIAQSAQRTGRAYSTISFREDGIRACAARTTIHGMTFTIVVAQSLHGQEKELEQVRHAFYVAVPLALLFAG